MNEKAFLTQDTEVKAKEVYSVLIDKLHSYFVVQGREARLDTVVDLLSALTSVVSVSRVMDDVQGFTQKEEEVDLI